ncbi:PTS sugar transporter subunit IIA [Ghiorsea bivora]|uniref:PTS sugar transporter subunit IIA n=1 Tax=Ghiorsea bivora TaxID=1485545 RepID=UPI00056E4E87|nr:PTS sugar transporter subunit IIA [Ghiorsea bivora]
MNKSIPVRPERVLLGSKAQSKRALLTEMAGMLSSMDPDLVLEVIMAREKLGSTGMGHGVAIPHGRMRGLIEPVIVVAIHEAGVDFDAIDDALVHIVVMLLVPDDNNKVHLELLATLARLLQQTDIRKALRDAPDAETVASLFAA